MNGDEQSNVPRLVEQSWLKLWSFYGVEFSQLDSLQERLFYRFKNKHFLYEAMTHKSAVVEYQLNGSRQHYPTFALPWNERLEFLGDSVLSLAISSQIWQLNNKKYNEGELSRRRSFLVKEKTLAKIAKSLKLSDCLILGKSEERNGGKKRDALLADFLEALLGAIYLDSSFDVVSNVISSLYQQIKVDDRVDYFDDYKSKLQEIYQGVCKMTPHYKTIEHRGPDHHREFKVGVFMKQKKIACAWGTSKKQASQEAARHALSIIETEKTSEVR